jgi:Fic family protein
MKTLQQLANQLTAIPVTTTWSLNYLSEARGKQELFTKQAPQKLKVLREHALIESAISSNRIEGVVIDQSRVGTVVFGKSRLRDRDEEEIRGYCNALKLIHEQGGALSISEATILRLHKLSHAGASDAGQFKEKDSDIIEKYPDGRERIRFRTVTAAQTPTFMRRLIESWQETLVEQHVPPLVALAAMNLDFLCIHPFRDGNGRASRLLLLLQSYHLGFEVGRYISLERLIEENKDRYYETLEQSSQGRHEGQHDPWPYINFVLFILKTAYREFEERVGQIASPRGAKLEIVQAAIERQVASFRIADLQRLCPGVSLDWIRQVLKTLRETGQVECLGRGQNAQWRKTERWGIR